MQFFYRLYMFDWFAYFAEAVKRLSGLINIPTHNQSRLTAYQQCLITIWYLANQGSYRVVAEQ